MTFFSSGYEGARTRFRDAVRAAGGRLHALPLEQCDPEGRPLTIDVGWLGSDRASHLVVHTSGVHGVEGFAGSAIQLQALSALTHRSGMVRPPRLPEQCAIVFVHIANPYGMAWLRRANEHNVDLNRNCLGAGDSYEGAPDGYGALDTVLNPTHPPGRADAFYPRALWLIARYGMPTLRQAVAGGQYVNRKGLFYGGGALEAGPSALRAFIVERMGHAERIVGIDVHTGLGPYGVETRLVSAEAGSEEFRRTQAAFGPALTPLDPTRGLAYRVKGTYDTLFRDALPHLDLILVGQEFGTFGSLRVLRALRTENAWHHARSIDATHPSRRALLRTFAPEDPAWRATVLTRGQALIDRALSLSACAV